MIDFEREDPNFQNQVAKIKVIGIGGAGCNTLNHMIDSKYENVEFIVVNTDSQALKISQATTKIQIGSKLTRGLGAGANPEIGRKATEEDLERVSEFLKEADIVFLSAGLGGGTGSGAIPVIAKVAKEMGVLCVSVVTKPFIFEGKKRMITAENALAKLKNHVDTLIVIPNQKLLDVVDHKVSLIEAFGMVNEITHQFVRSIADIILKPGHINVDFSDICTIMRNMGLAVMGTGRASGADRAQKAALQAISSPLLECADIHCAKAILLNIAGNSNLGLREVHSAASIIHQTAQDAEIIMGSVIDESLGEEVLVTIIATGIEEIGAPENTKTKSVKLEERKKEHAEERIIPAKNSSDTQVKEQIENNNKNLEKLEDNIKDKKHEDDVIDKKSREEDSLDRKKISLDDMEIPTYLRNISQEGAQEKKEEEKNDKNENKENIETETTIEKKEQEEQEAP